jgi:hypothetical protein
MNPSPSLEHLLGRLAVVEARVKAAVHRRRAGDPEPDDPFRGLYLTEEQVDRLLDVPAPPPTPDAATADLLARIEEAADGAEAGDEDIRLRRLAKTFDLEPLDTELLLVALAPDLDARFERLYGYLHDDVTRRRASVGLSLELCGASPADARARRRLQGGSPLIEAGLILVEDMERPLLTRTLRVPDRVAAHLLGDDHPDHALAPLLASPVTWDDRDDEALARAIADGARLCYLRERLSGAGRGLAAAAFARMGIPTLALDLARLTVEDDPTAMAAAAGREAGLRGAGLVVGPVEQVLERGAPAVRAFAEIPWPVVITGTRNWDPAWSREIPLLVEVGLPGPEQRASMWHAHLDGDTPAELDAAAVMTAFRLGPEQVARAATSARLRASYAGRAVDPTDLRAGARAQNAAGLERLARRIEPAVWWQDLVLPADTFVQLKELAARAKYRERVLDEWGMRQGGPRGGGITALFAGESGTGKTMSAEVLAAELGLDLYTIDLATVVDKYIGETEKNLERIFSEAEGVNGVLFFDEADALFGKRSEVKDAHDRYANIETAYLLQRMETFEGMAILATNLRANLDEAFTRRLDVIVDFPMPDEDHRRRLWDKCLGPAVPKDSDLDLDFLAHQFELSGGNIRNICVTAAYLAVDADRAMSMEDLVRGVQREYRKLGRLCVEAEFGRFFYLVSTSEAQEGTRRL